MSIIEATNLEKHYPCPEKSGETFAAVNNINLSINTGEVFGLLGPNGAGKTTTLEMLEGLSVIDRGDVLVDSIDVKKKSISGKEDYWSSAAIKRIF